MSGVVAHVTMATADSIIPQGCQLLIEDRREALFVGSPSMDIALLHCREVETGDREAVKQYDAIPPLTNGASPAVATITPLEALTKHRIERHSYFRKFETASELSQDQEYSDQEEVLEEWPVGAFVTRSMRH